jgi:phosphonate transport system substrate-binding protein
MTSLSRAAETYSVGVVPQFDARRVQAIWQPILTEVAKRSGVQLELVGSPDIPQFETQLMAGEFDFAYMNPYHLIKAHTGQGYSPLVRDVGRTLYGIVVVRKDSPIQRVEELDGKLIAFPAPNALGASLIPRAEFSETYKINIQPRYVRSHGSVYLNVVTGETAAGGGVQKTLQQQPENIRNALRIVYKTSEVAPHPFAAHPRVPAAVRERIRQAFLQLGGTNEGQALLTKIPAKVIGPASLEDYQALRTMGLDKYYVE